MTTYAYGGDPTGLAGKYHYGIGSLGTRGDAIPSTGAHGPGYIYPSLSLPLDAAKEYYGLLGAIPDGLTMDASEDSGFEASATEDGVYVVPWTLYEFGVLVGTTSLTLTFGAGIMLAGAGTLFGLASGTGAVTVDPPESGTINLAGADTTFGLISGAGTVEVVPPATGVVNLSGADCAFALASGDGAVDVVPFVPGVVNLIAADCSLGLVSGVSFITVARYVRAPAGGGYRTKRTDTTTRPSEIQDNNR